MSTVSAEARLEAAGIVLPAALSPAANYLPAVRTGNLLFLAGQGPLLAGRPEITGKVGAQVSQEEGYRAARMATINALAVLRAELGSLDHVVRIVKLLGFVNSAPGFTSQHLILNGASDLLVAVFGEAGRHARSAVGVNELPFDIAVEVEMIVEVRPGA
jgi:enamine deaminase RidA (YjgF/YER057c/UK114 family)